MECTPLILALVHTRYAAEFCTYWSDQLLLHFDSCTASALCGHATTQKLCPTPRRITPPLCTPSPPHRSIAILVEVIQEQDSCLLSPVKFGALDSYTGSRSSCRRILSYVVVPAWMSQRWYPRKHPTHPPAIVRKTSKITYNMKSLLLLERMFNAREAGARVATICHQIIGSRGARLSTIPFLSIKVTGNLTRLATDAMIHGH
jgi:hypothetical protein